MGTDSPAVGMVHAAGPRLDINGPLLQASHLSFAYSVAPVVADVSLSLARGEIGALIGANGSGKSNLLGLFALLSDLANQRLQLHVRHPHR